MCGKAFLRILNILSYTAKRFPELFIVAVSVSCSIVDGLVGKNGTSTDMSEGPSKIASFSLR